MSLFPGFSWHAVLKTTDIKLELMVAIDIYQFTAERHARGYILHRLSI